MVTHMLTGMLLSTLLFTGIPTAPTSAPLQEMSEVNTDILVQHEISYEVKAVQYEHTKTDTSKQTEAEKASMVRKSSENETEETSAESKKSYIFGKKRKNQAFPEISSKVVNKTITYSYVPAEDTEDIEHSDTYRYVQRTCIWKGDVIDHRGGINKGPNGDETYYNLDMTGVVEIMRKMGNTDPYWVRSDGVHMIGNYVMIASDLRLRPRGTIYETSRGMAMVCDTGSFAEDNPMQTDIAVIW